MSAPSPRGPRGGSATKGPRATPSSATRGHGSVRGGSPRGTAPAREKGKGGASANVSTSTANKLLQRLRSGTAQRGSHNGATTPGRGEVQSTMSLPFLRDAAAAKTDQVPVLQQQAHLLQTTVDEFDGMGTCRNPSILPNPKFPLPLLHPAPAPPLRRLPITKIS